MKKHLIINVLFLLVGTALFASCDKNDDDEPDNSGNKTDNQYTVDPEIEAMSSRLFNTSWTYQSSDYYDDNGRYSDSRTEFADKFTFTFSDKLWSNNRYLLIVNGDSNSLCYWYIDDDGLSYTSSMYLYSIQLSASDVGSWIRSGGAVFGGYIYTLTNSKLIIKDYYSNGINYVQHSFKAASNPSGGSSGNTGYEKPDIGFYDFTATKTSLKVQYKICNKDEAKVSSAIIYYGTSSNPSLSKTATVSGVLITANITGLKAGTTYYVKCVATGKGGKTGAVANFRC